MNKFDFSFDDTIAGYVESLDWHNNVFTMKTSDERLYEVKLTETTYAEMMRNLGDSYVDCTGSIRDMLEPGKFLYTYGMFYPNDEASDADNSFEAKHIVFVGREAGHYEFERQDWWIKQVTGLADFYLKGQFGAGVIDYKKYRTNLNLEGEQTGTMRQETDTISRLVYGFASAYLMTGEDRYLEAAEKGTKYLQEHFKNHNKSDETAFWYHAVDLKGDRMKKIFASEFGDDFDAIPAYEQIYALAGPTQTYRITGDNSIKTDIDHTINLFQKYFLDRRLGGYFSHIDPVTFDPRSENLNDDRARKNWNSIGDHVPAYLINVLLATDEPQYKEMLEYIGDLIVKYFPDYDNSPFVQEKFHEDWSKDQSWKWQQNRGVMGHNLKIAWNLMRLHSLISKDDYLAMAEKIAQIMPAEGGDPQRGGWYDVLERELQQGQRYHRCVWHNRKAWWQQEQGILAYLILSGTVGKDNYLKYARESAAFYNTWFLDHDSGSVYFNVLANGMPYLLGTERMKGSHSMSGYHSFELAYLAAVYTNLLVTKHHMDFHFKPYPHSLKDNILRVKPDILPEGSIKLERVWVNGKEYSDFDAAALTVKLPASDERLKVKVRIVPAKGVEHFDAVISQEGDTTTITLSGDLDSRALNDYRSSLSEVTAGNPSKVILDLTNLNSMSGSGARLVLFERQKLSIDCEIIIRGANDEVKALFESDEFSESVTIE